MSDIQIREAREGDFEFVATLMDDALKAYYDGDHRAHAERIFNTHISGGADNVGHFSAEQRMFILTDGEQPIGMINVVGKRQGTWKISPLIVAPEARGVKGCGSQLLAFAEGYARDHGARQMYCTVAQQNKSAYQFFRRKGYHVAGMSESHYKPGVTGATPKKGEPIKLMPCVAHDPQAFAAMLEVEPHDKIVPDVSKPEALRLLQDIYPPNKERLGVLVFELEVVQKG